MKALAFDHPCRSSVLATAEPESCGRNHDVGTVWVDAHLVDITIDVDRRLPGAAAIRRARNAANVDIRQEHRTIGTSSNRAHSERRPEHTTINQSLPRVPFVAPRNFMKAVKLHNVSTSTDAENTSIVGPGVNNVSARHTTSQVELCICDCAPHTIGGAVFE
ncbi:MAG: hypothetical protein JKY56_20705 [Kofleriaceae bacterium]|nr:hypothetical protein [Kofleriaceae bacterium]